MRVALLALALSLAACGGGDPANNAVDAGIDEATAASLCRLDGGRPVLVRDWGPDADPPGCMGAERAICTPEQRAACPRGDTTCCHRREWCGDILYRHCL